MTNVRRRKPDFICIGPTKTGTSWLWTVLRQHPDIWLPPVSEINFFWGTGKRMQKDTRWANLKQRIKGDIRIRWRRTYAKERIVQYKANPSQRTWKNISWDLRYILTPQSPAWYLSLFPKDKVAGDITGGYFTMDDAAIAQLAKHLPDTKIIMTFRDPVSRLWSEARMILLFLARKSMEQVPDAAFYQRFDRAFARLPSYIGLYQRWRKHFPENQILICYYDDLQKDPTAYLKSICAFLEVPFEMNPQMTQVLQTRIFEGLKIPLPDRFREYLVKLTRQSVKELAASSNSPHPNAWLEKYQ